jgi:hypothetical protein
MYGLKNLTACLLCVIVAPHTPADGHPPKNAERGAVILAQTPPTKNSKSFDEYTKKLDELSKDCDVRRLRDNLDIPSIEKIGLACEQKKEVAKQMSNLPTKSEAMIGSLMLFEAASDLALAYSKYGAARIESNKTAAIDNFLTSCSYAKVVRDVCKNSPEIFKIPSFEQNKVRCGAPDTQIKLLDDILRREARKNCS